MTKLLDHPETQEVFTTLLKTLIGESDRGAVLVGTAHVDNQLRSLFEAVVSHGMSRKRRKALLTYPGPLGTASAKVEVAYALRLIPRPLYEAIHALRRIRNDVAHNPDSFGLREQHDRVRQLYELGPGVAGGLRQMAMRMLLDYKAFVAIETVKEWRTDEDGASVVEMSTRADFAEYLSEHPDVMDSLEEQLPQWEMALGIAVICGWLIRCRDETMEVLAEDRLLTEMVPKAEAQKLEPERDEPEARGDP